MHDPHTTQVVTTATIMAIIMASVLAYLLVTSRKRRCAMREAASRLGLRLMNDEPFFPSVSVLSWLRKASLATGVYQGHPVLVHNFNVGRSSYHGVKVLLRYKSPLRLIVQERGLAAKLDFAVGVKKVLTGNELFDSHFLLRSNEPVMASAIVSTPELCKAIEDFYKCGMTRRVELRNNLVIYSVSGGLMGEKAVARVITMMNICTSLAESVDAATEVLHQPGNGSPRACNASCLYN
jgi:hypothetical protein